MALSAPSGFAVRRNGTCLSSEVDCGATVAPFRACCLAGASCPHQYNVDCCPSPTSCTQALLQSPGCANSTWTLYDNGRYFCCAPGTIGYGELLTSSDGCANPGSPPEGAQLLNVVLAGQIATSSSASSAASSATSSSSSSSFSSIALPSHSLLSSASPSPSGSSSNTGAIAGGMGGGVAAIASVLLISIWFFRKRKNQARSPRSHLGDSSGSPYRDDATTRTPHANEADGVARCELFAGREPNPAVELQ